MKNGAERIAQDYKPPAAPASPATGEHFRWLATGLALPVLGGIMTFGLFREQPAAPALPELDLLRISVQALPETPFTEPPQPIGETVEFVVRRNDTMERIFRRLRLSLQDLAAIRALPDVRASVDFLRPGDLIRLVHVDGALRSLERRVSETEILSVVREEETFASRVITTPLETRTVRRHGHIDSSLFAAARSVGVSSEVIMRLANDIFGWDIDFALEIRPGDQFAVVYEQKFRDGEYLGDGQILAAEFMNAGRTYRAVRYDSADGKVGDFFTPEGRSMRRQFLRAPVDFTRISSNFNPRRRHPILNVIRAHKGVDYAAPTGTPIRAAGEGRVSFVGTKGGYGRAVILEHGGGITTLYGHMSSFARGLRKGSRIKQGQTIGFVGRSGLATAPHLHYEYRINGMHKNPRTVPLPNAEPIPHEYLADFQSRIGNLLAELDHSRDALVAATPGG